LTASDRDPGVLAKMAVTVDQLSGVRLEFGTRNDRADRLEESVQIIR
jgi:hypothetical protein